MARRRSGLRNVSKVRKILRTVPEAVERHVRPAIVESAKVIEATAITLVRKRTRLLANSLGHHIGRDGMSAKIGINPGPGKKRAAFRSSAFYGWFIEMGTKGGKTKKGAVVPPRRAFPFMRPAYLINKRWVVDRITAGVNAGLRSVAHAKR